MRTLMVVVGLLAALFWLAGCGGTASGAAVSCEGPFSVAAGEGATLGDILTGKLSINIDVSGNLSGAFSRSGQPDVAVVGQVVGRSVNLAADLGNGRYLFGTGTAYDMAGGCPAVAGGPMTMQTVGSGTASVGSAKLLAPAGQVIIERTGAWSLRATAP